MRTVAAFVLAVVAVVLGGCSDREFTCTAARQCIDKRGASGLCLQMHCAFPSNECASGYKWDDAAGDTAGECLDSALIPADAGPDARPADARPGDAG